MARKNSSDKIKDLQRQMKKIEQQLKEQEKKRDEELGKIFREEWGIEDSDTARLIIESLKSDVEKIIKSSEDNLVSSEIENPNNESKDESKKIETLVSQSST
ncbi:MAG: hypothetical protein WAM95_21500 [Bacillus sp. (in: firmicutes)]